MWFWAILGNDWCHMFFALRCQINFCWRTSSVCWLLCNVNLFFFWTAAGIRWSICIIAHFQDSFSSAFVSTFLPSIAVLFFWAWHNHVFRLPRLLITPLVWKVKTCHSQNIWLIHKISFYPEHKICVLSTELHKYDSFHKNWIWLGGEDVDLTVTYVKSRQCAFPMWHFRHAWELWG